MGPCSSKREINPEQQQQPSKSNEIQPEGSAEVGGHQNPSVGTNIANLFAFADPQQEVPVVQAPSEQSVPKIVGVGSESQAPSKAVSAGKDKKSGKSDLPTEDKEKQKEKKYIPQNIVVKPETLNRALQINSEAIRFETERPIIELKSPYIEAAF